MEHVDFAKICYLREEFENVKLTRRNFMSFIMSFIIKCTPVIIKTSWAEQSHTQDFL